MIEREFEECEEFENWNDKDTCGFFNALSEVKVKIFFSWYLTTVNQSEEVRQHRRRQNCVRTKGEETATPGVVAFCRKKGYREI